MWVPTWKDAARAALLTVRALSMVVAPFFWTRKVYALLAALVTETAAPASPLASGVMRMAAALGRGEKDVAAVVAELLAKGGRKRVVVAADGACSCAGHELALEDFEDRGVAVPPGFDVGLGNAGEVVLRSCGADCVGDNGPFQIGASADGAGFKRGVDGAFDPEAVVPIGAAVFVGGEEGGGSVRDS